MDASSLIFLLSCWMENDGQLYDGENTIMFSSTCVSILGSFNWCVCAAFVQRDIAAYFGYAWYLNLYFANKLLHMWVNSAPAHTAELVWIAFSLRCLCLNHMIPGLLSFLMFTLSSSFTFAVQLCLPVSQPTAPYQLICWVHQIFCGQKCVRALFLLDSRKPSKEKYKNQTNVNASSRTLWSGSSGRGSHWFTASAHSWSHIRCSFRIGLASCPSVSLIPLWVALLLCVWSVLFLLCLREEI